MKSSSNEIGQSETFSHRKKELHKLIVARQDIEGALETCDFFLSLKNDHEELYYAMSTAIVISYSRPFSANKPYGPLPSKWSKFNDKRYEVIHSQLLKLRHKAIAHSDLSVNKVWIYPPGATLPDMNETSEEWRVAVNRRLLNKRMLLEIRPMCYDLWSRLKLEIQKQVEELFKEKKFHPERFELNFDIENSKQDVL